jgi:hypothetical protein
MSSPVQAHSKVIFRDEMLGAALPSIAAAYVTTSGDARVFSTARPETAVFVNDGTGTYVLTDLPVAPDADILEAVFVGDTVHVY